MKKITKVEMKCSGCGLIQPLFLSKEMQKMFKKVQDQSRWPEKLEKSFWCLHEELYSALNKFSGAILDFNLNAKPVKTKRPKI